MYPEDGIPTNKGCTKDVDSMARMATCSWGALVVSSDHANGLVMFLGVLRSCYWSPDVPLSPYILLSIGTWDDSVKGCMWIPCTCVAGALCCIPSIVAVRDALDVLRMP